MIYSDANSFSMFFEMHAFLQTDSISITVSCQLHFVSVNMMVNAKEERLGIRGSTSSHIC